MSKEVTGFRPGSESWKNFMAKLYGIGAAVVIVGALFKIQHCLEVWTKMYLGT